FVPNAMVEPSGDTSHAYALSRSFRGTPPRTGTIHVLVRAENHSSPLTGVGCERARNFWLSGNHAPTSQTRFSLADSSGWGTDCASSLPTSLMCMPCRSVNARYFPSGEILPPLIGFSGELSVSWVSFTSGRPAEN